MDPLRKRAPAPFDTLLYCPCEESWQKGAPGVEPPFQRNGAMLHHSGVHMLLRRANLPEAELRHMGALQLMQFVPHAQPEASVAPILGRIVLDHREVKWHGRKFQRDEAAKLGHEVIARWFA